MEPAGSPVHGVRVVGDCSIQNDPRAAGAHREPAESARLRRAVGNPLPTDPNYAWTDLTWLLHKDNVSWAYYVDAGSQPDCDDNAAMSCAPVIQTAKTPGIWNPLPYFTDVQQDDQLGDIEPLPNFFAAAKNGELPAVVVDHAERRRSASTRRR